MRAFHIQIEYYYQQLYLRTLRYLITNESLFYSIKTHSISLLLHIVVTLFHRRYLGGNIR
jgi:hypothetical protein